MPVYIMSYEGEEHEHVKIGWAHSIIDRMNTFQCGHHKKTVLLRKIEGSRKAEAWMHKQFTHLRVRGEWFTFSPDMMTVSIPESFPKYKSRPSKSNGRIRIEPTFCGFPDFTNPPVFEGRRIQIDEWAKNKNELEADGWKFVGQIEDRFYIRKLVSGPMPDNTPCGWIG